ncbi:MAG: UrcA family protein [bacterium]|nr:UrcA family protein [Gammaproteobacteria bacterium]HIL96577.1 UrcA family protein [Pseudomonadales bacterium]
MKINPKSVIAAAVLFTLTTPMMATAAVKTSQISDNKIVVSYNASELKTVVGKRYLENEIKRAARKICGSTSYSDVRSVRQVSANKTCYAETVSNSMERIQGHTSTAD